MEFITIREFRANTAKMWRKLKRERQLILTRRGKPVAMITSTSDREVGEALREDLGRKALAAMKEMQQEAKRHGLSGMTMEEIDAVIAEARREKRNAHRG